jgi:hypothetical protein
VIRWIAMTERLKPTSATSSGAGAAGAAGADRVVGIVPPPQPGKLEYARDQMGAFQRWLSRTASIENIFAFFKTAAWVVPLTILIWVYAEREQVAKKTDVTIPIAVKSVDPTRVVQLRISGHAIMTELVGPRAQVERVYDIVTRPADEPAVQIELGRNYTPGRSYTLDTARLVGDNPIFRARGVLLSDCKPNNIEIFVDELVEREVEVKLPPKSPPVAATFEPRTVKVRGPKSALGGEGEPLEVYADVAGRPELRSQGQHELGAVPLICSIQNPAIRIEPASVRVAIDVAQTDERFTIDAMPIWPLTPPGLREDYKVEFTPTITKISVSGPQDKIDLLRNKSFLPKAILEVRDEDKGKTQQRALRFDLPDGVSVVPEDRAKANWSFKVSKNTPD